MKSQRTHYVIFFLALGIISWSLYFRVAFDGWITLNVNEPYLLKRLLSKFLYSGINEIKLKGMAISAPIIAAYLHRYYSDKKINIKLHYVFLALGVLAILYPLKRIIHLPPYLGMVISVVGYLLFLRSVMTLSVFYFSKKLSADQFNTKNQSFPQTTKKINGKHTFSLTYDFINNKKKRRGYLNFVNVFRSVFVWGTMGSGKTYTFIAPIIYELMKLGFSLLVYDLKYPSLSSKTFGFYKSLKPKNVSFFQICTTNMIYSNRCNPAATRYIPTITKIEKICDNVFTNLKRPDEQESAFFKGTAMGLFIGLTALSRDMEIKHRVPVSSIPHVAILASVKPEYLLPILLSKRELIMKVSSLRDAFIGGSALEQLTGITASLQNILSRLYQEDAFYIFSGEGDFSLDLNNPDHKKIVTVGCDKDMTDVMAPYLSMVVETVGKEANKPKKSAFASILDELTSFYYSGLLNFLESGRENKCALVAGAQGLEQMEKKYPRTEATSILGIQGSIICGMGGMKTATEISKRIGKTNQKRTGLNQQLEGSQSLNHNFFREDLMPIDRIGNFTQGEFCGVMTDSLEYPIEQKRFWGKFRKHPCHEIEKTEMEIIHNFWNEEAKDIFKTHWTNMISKGFFQDFQSAIEKDEHVFVSKSVSFYSKYLDITSEDLELLKRVHKTHASKKEKSKFTYEKYLANFFSYRLEQTIIQNEKSQFLKNYLDQMFSDIEFWVRKEFESLTGEKINDDLFNISDFKQDDLEEVPF